MRLLKVTIQHLQRAQLQKQSQQLQQQWVSLKLTLLFLEWHALKGRIDSNQLKILAIVSYLEKVICIIFFIL